MVISLLDVRDKFRGSAASIDELIESFAIERVPANQPWPMPVRSTGEIVWGEQHEEDRQCRPTRITRWR